VRLINITVANLRCLNRRIRYGIISAELMQSRVRQNVANVANSCRLAAINRFRYLDTSDVRKCASFEFFSFYFSFSAENELYFYFSFMFQPEKKQYSTFGCSIFLPKKKNHFRSTSTHDTLQSTQESQTLAQMLTVA